MEIYMQIQIQIEMRQEEIKMEIFKEKEIEMGTSKDSKMDGTDRDRNAEVVELCINREQTEKVEWRQKRQAKRAYLLKIPCSSVLLLLKNDILI